MTQLSALLNLIVRLVLQRVAHEVSEIKQDVRDARKLLESQVQLLRGLSDMSEETKQQLEQLAAAVEAARGQIIDGEGRVITHHHSSFL